MLLKGREGRRGRAEGGRRQMGGAHESLLPGRVNALLIRCISHIAVGLPLFLRKERTILQSIAPDCTPGYTKSKAAVFWRGYKVSRIGHFCDCISLSFSYISFPLRGIHGVFPGRGGLLRRYKVKVSEGLMATHGVLQPMVGHASEGGALYHVPIFMPWKTHTEGGRKYYPE